MIDYQRVMELYEAQKSDYAIAQEVDTEPGRIWAWRKRRGLPANHPAFGARREKQEEPKRKEKPMRRGNPCRGCVYLGRAGGHSEKLCWCEFILVTGHRRPCPSGEHCTVRQISAGRYRHEQEAYSGV